VTAKNKFKIKNIVPNGLDAVLDVDPLSKRFSPLSSR
jgi:hypothetical protein